MWRSPTRSGLSRGLERTTSATFKAGCSLASAALCGDRPHRFHSVASVNRVDAVQVHRRVAMARHQAYDVAKAQINRAATHPNQPAVFVPGKVELEVIPAKDLRRPSVAAGRLPAGINNDPVRRRLADHTGQDAQGRAKGRRAALFVPAELPIACVHEDVTARLKLLQNPKIEIKADAARPTPVRTSIACPRARTNAAASRSPCIA